MRLDEFTGDDWAVLGFSFLTIVSLLFFPWFSIDGLHLSGTSSPDAWVGVFALIAAIEVFADQLLERVSASTQMWAFRGDRKATRLIMALLTAVLVVLKFLLHLHIGQLQWGFWVSVIGVVGLVYSTEKANGGRLPWQ